MPTNFELFDRVIETFTGLSVESFIDSIELSLKYILYAVLIAFVFSFLMTFFLEKCTGVLVTIAILGFFTAAGFLCYICWGKYNELEAAIPTSDDKEKAERAAKIMKIVAYSLTAITACLVCLTCCLLSRIFLACKIISVYFPINPRPLLTLSSKPNPSSSFLW